MAILTVSSCIPHSLRHGKENSSVSRGKKKKISPFNTGQSFPLPSLACSQLQCCSAGMCLHVHTGKTLPLTCSLNISCCPFLSTCSQRTTEKFGTEGSLEVNWSMYLPSALCQCFHLLGEEQEGEQILLYSEFWTRYFL